MCHNCKKAYASCSGCQQWKCILEEQWTRKEVQNQRLRASALLCKTCRRKGMTKRSSGMKECAACKKSFGRTAFDGKDLENRQQKEKAKLQYILVCTSCKKREASIMGSINALKADTCRFSCSSTWRHQTTCPTIKQTNLRISEADLTWVQFRSQHRSSVCVTDLAYYRACGVLIP